MVQDLNHGPYETALTREKILAKLGPELTADLYVNSSWRDRPPSSASLRMEEDQSIGGSGAQDDEEGEPVSDSPRAITRLERNAGDIKLVPGSNNWVVSDNTRSRESRSCRTICTLATKCRISGTRRTCAAVNMTLRA
jgi:hypothetical protein